MLMTTPPRVRPTGFAVSTEKGPICGSQGSYTRQPILPRATSPLSFSSGESSSR
jgi:hypothetical protein